MSLFYSEELSPFEPRPNPFQSFLSSLLQFNSSQPPKPNKMASTSTNPTTNGTSSKEVKMVMPREFSGKRTDLNRFIMSCMAHLVVNKDIYHMDEKKIGFLLSLLNDREAGAWKEQFIQEAFNEAMANGEEAEMMFGTFPDFLKRLKESFEPHNNAALTQLRALQYKLGDNIDEHITKFRMCLAWTKLDKSDGSQATIEFFKETLPPQLLQRIYGGETILETLTGWYKKTALQEQIRQDIK